MSKNFESISDIIIYLINEINKLESETLSTGMKQSINTSIEQVKTLVNKKDELKDLMTEFDKITTKNPSDLFIKYYELLIQIVDIINTKIEELHKEGRKLYEWSVQPSDFTYDAGLKEPEKFLKFRLAAESTYKALIDTAESINNAIKTEKYYKDAIKNFPDYNEHISENIIIIAVYIADMLMIDFTDYVYDSSETLETFPAHPRERIVECEKMIEGAKKIEEAHPENLYDNNAIFKKKCDFIMEKINNVVFDKSDKNKTTTGYFNVIIRGEIIKLVQKAFVLNKLYIAHNHKSDYSAQIIYFQNNSIIEEKYKNLVELVYNSSGNQIDTGKNVNTLFPGFQLDKAVCFKCKVYYI